MISVFFFNIIVIFDLVFIFLLNIYLASLIIMWVFYYHLLFYYVLNDVYNFYFIVHDDHTYRLKYSIDWFKF